MIENPHKWLTRGDVLVLLLATVLLSTLYIYYWSGSGRDSQALVMVNGKSWARLNLFNNQDFRVSGALGDSVLRVRDGKVRFMDSPCSTKQCVHQGWISRSGEVAVCLPNRVSIRIPAVDPRYDSINF